jgi:hypothetical protein
MSDNPIVVVNIAAFKISGVIGRGRLAGTVYKIINNVPTNMTKSASRKQKITNLSGFMLNQSQNAYLGWTRLGIIRTTVWKGIGNSVSLALGV